MKYKIKDCPQIAELVDKMTLPELLSAVTCPDIRTDEVYTNTASVFLHPDTDENIRKRIELVRKNRSLPVIICADTESGADISEKTTLFPSLRACGVADNPEFSFVYGKTAATEAAEYKITWGLAPCVDILFDEDDPVAGNNCAGRDADKVIQTVCAVANGMQSHGLAATVKHFPGGGMCKYDPHLTTAENPLPLKSWHETYGRVYRTAIDAGVKSVMPGHISLPCYDSIDPETGEYPPATLSEKLLTGLLKNELGFEGIIISDACVMGGFCSYTEYYRACARFLMAGGDVLLFVHPNDEYIKRMTEYTESGFLNIDVLKNRAYRALCFAKENEFSGYIEMSDKEKDDAVNYITKYGIEIERDRYSYLHTDVSSKNILIYVISHNGIRDFDYDLCDLLSEKCKSVKLVSDIGSNAMVQEIKSGKYDLCVCTVNHLSGFGINTGRLSGTLARNMMGGWQKVGVPVVFVTHSNNFKNEYKICADTIINTHGYAKNSAKYVCEIICS